jgi:altronate hydrolase
MGNKIYLRIHKSDNVAVALDDISAGTIVGVQDFEPLINIKIKKDIPRGHKFAISIISRNDNVIKYGCPIGYALSDIQPGEHVHVHNIKTLLKGTKDYIYTPDFEFSKETVNIPCFDGFMRPNGDVGIRNELWIIPTVGCVNKIAEALERKYTEKLSKEIDGVYAFQHPYGCSQLGDDHHKTQTILADLVNHPNAGGVLVVGLGCENNTMDSFKEIIGDVDRQKVRYMIVQNIEDELHEGMKHLDELNQYASSFKREPIPVSKLKIGLKCGASDGLSGITANPLIGVFSDKLIALGGTTVLTEVPEMFGAEEMLMNRCRNEDVFNKCVHMVNSFKDYFIRYNQVVYENPSPGNKDGGITTLEDKSLGCTQKGGTSPVMDVLEYGDVLKTSGLNLLSGPGNDIVAVTALASAGAHMVLFTTGRGTPFGGPVPTLKISSNSDLNKHKKHWIDFNAGCLVDNNNLDELSDEFLQYVIDVASGKITASNEKLGYREIAIFKDGVTL